jgi:single-strand DNA-binding protein
MAYLNKIFLMGNLTRDPELKFTPQGQAIAKFSIAVNRSFKGSDGEMKKQTDFFNIIVWGKQGENCSKYLSKGRPVHIEGRLQNRSYETQDKQKRTVTEIVADNVQFLSGGGPGGPGAGSGGAPSGSPRPAAEDTGYEMAPDSHDDAGFNNPDEVPF